MRNEEMFRKIIEDNERKMKEALANFKVKK